jgi:cbb3-type cytochrome oxidase maturation protein
MNIVLVMLGLSVVLLLGAAAAFFWAVDHGQFEDMEGSSLLPLDDYPQKDVSGVEKTSE